MRPVISAVLLLAVAPLPAQRGPIMAFARQALSPTFKLLQWKVDQASALESEPEIRPLLDYDLSFVSLTERTKARWGGEWGANPKWGLGTPEGRVLETWDREPTAAEVLSLMRREGWVPIQERLESFLREHPDHGEARLAELRVLVPRLLATLEEKTGPGEEGRWTVDAEARRTFNDRLQALLGGQGWARSQALRMTLAMVLGNDELREALLEGDLRRVLKEGVEEELAHTPSDFALWAFYGQLCGPEDASAARSFLEALPAPPGQAWPPSEAAFPVGEILGRAKDWTGLEAMASWGRAQSAGRPGSGGILGRQPESTWTGLGVWAMWEQGRKEEALRGLEEAFRGKPGPGIMQALGHLMRGASEPERKRIQELMREGRSSMGDVFRREDPPVPVRLLKVGDPAWAKGFAVLSQHPAFDAWGGSELAFLEAQGEEAKKLKARFGSGWVLMKGDEVLASAAELPAPQALADRVRGFQTPRLEALGSFLRSHPDQAEARRARLALLRSRMPHPRLEMQLMEDARRLAAPFRAGEGWKPTAELWLSPARRLVPELEQHLSRWPSDPQAWAAWVEWSALLPSPPTPADLLQRLPVFRMREWRGLNGGPLPFEVAAAVASRLKDGGRWKELDAWCSAFWEGGMRKELPTLLATPENPRFIPGLGRGDLQALGPGLIQPWLEAMDRLQAKGRHQALAQDLESLQPGLAKKLMEKGERVRR